MKKYVLFSFVLLCFNACVGMDDETELTHKRNQHSCMRTFRNHLKNGLDEVATPKPRVKREQDPKRVYDYVAFTVAPREAVERVYSSNKVYNAIIITPSPCQSAMQHTSAWQAVRLPSLEQLTKGYNSEGDYVALRDADYFSDSSEESDALTISVTPPNPYGK